MKHKDYVWMKITKDKYELPVAVANSAPELARMLGVTANCIYSSISKKRKSIIRVEIDEDEEEQNDD